MNSNKPGANYHATCIEHFIVRANILFMSIESPGPGEPEDNNESVTAVVHGTNPDIVVFDAGAATNSLNLDPDADVEIVLFDDPS